MHRYDYHRPRSLAEALRLRAELPEARVIAGGTDLLVRLRDGRRPAPPALISVRRISELQGIELGAETRLGAAVTIGELLSHAALKERFPLLAKAGKALGSVQIRNAATLGGNLCNASPCADLALPLLVYGARARLVSTRGSRELPVDDFLVGPGETRLASDEVLADFLLPEPAPGVRSAFLKQTRVAMDIALASVAVAFVVAEGRPRDVRIAAGSVAPRPLRLRETEREVEQAGLGPEALLRIAERARAEVRPISDLRASANYRRELSGVLVTRALAQASQEKSA